VPIYEERGGAVSYDEYGAGPVIVLVHGSPATSRAWQRVAERLSTRFRVIAPNLPGYGQTPPAPPGRRGNAGYAAEAIESLAGLAGPPLVLAGHSFGGVVALRAALRGAMGPRALALFEPVAVPVLDAIGDGAGFAAARGVFDDYTSSFDAGDGHAVRKMADFWFGRGAFERMPSPMRDFLLANTGQNVQDVRATFGERYTGQSLGQLEMPVLAVHGSRSPAVMAAICEAIASRVPRGSLAVLDGADHALTATHADAVAGLIADLADRSAAAPARV